MTIKLKTWAGLGLGTVALGAGLAACGEAGEQPAPDADPTQAAAHGEMGEGEGGEGEGGEGEGGEHGAMATLPLPKRLAFMTGHVEAGLALYRAGEPEMAAPHLLHPVSETHQAERAGLDAIGFKPELFETVSRALEEGRPAAEIEPQLAAAEANLAMMAERAGGDPAEIIRYLMAVTVEEYEIAISDGVVSDPGEYQDAFGFSVVARDRAAAGFDPASDELMQALNDLIALWPDVAPIPPEDPAPLAQVAAQTSRVILALPQ